MTGTKYTVVKTGDHFVAWADGKTRLGQRPKYKQAQRLCEQQAGRPLDWTSLGGGNYEATR